MSSRPVNQEPEDDDLFSTIAHHFEEKVPEDIPRPSVDAIIKDFHDLCEQNGMTFTFVLSNTWVMRAICPHGTSVNYSENDYVFVEALLGLYAIVEKQHKGE